MRILIALALLFIGCDSKIKRCEYEVYQHGVKIPSLYTKYVRVSEWCESHSKDGVVYKLIGSDIIKVKDIRHK